MEENKIEVSFENVLFVGLFSYLTILSLKGTYRSFIGSNVILMKRRPENMWMYQIRQVKLISCMVRKKSCTAKIGFITWKCVLIGNIFYTENNIWKNHCLALFASPVLQ